MLELRLSIDGFIVHVDDWLAVSHSGGLGKLLLLHVIVVPLKVLPPSELLHHDHLVLPLIRCLLQQASLLLLLGQVNDVGPPLLVLGLEVLQELIEVLVPLRHALDRLVQRLSRSALVLLDEGLQLLDLLDGPGAHDGLFLLRLGLSEEEHLALLVLALVGVQDELV